MLNCHEATRLMSEAQERKLSLKEKSALEVHRMMCSGCRNFGKQMQVLHEIAHAYVQGADESASGATPQGDNRN